MSVQPLCSECGVYIHDCKCGNIKHLSSKDAIEGLIDQLITKDKEIAEYKVFANDTKDMRALQVEYFKNRNQVVLMECKTLEAHIDRLIIRFGNRDDGQSELFGELSDVEPGHQKGAKDD